MPGAIIDEWFATQQAWPRPYAQEMVDTRASSQYVTMASGLLVARAPGVLPISDITMLVEPSRINLLSFSKDASNAVWSTQDATKTPNAGVAPDGTNTAVSITTTGDIGNNFYQQYTSAVLGSVYAPSVWVNGINGQQIFFAGNTSTNSEQLTLTFNGSWQRVVGNPSTGSGLGNTQFFGFERFNRNGGAHLPDVTFLAWPQGQFELGSAPTSPIVTTSGSATRAANAITLQRTGISRIVFTFDDNSQQTISGINTASQYTIPTNLNRSLIKRMTGYAS